MPRLIDQIYDELQKLPIKDHIKEWKVIHNSTIRPAKVGLTELDKWDLKVHFSYQDISDNTKYVVVGLKVK